ncbi:MAG: VOC family protein [Bacteroidetes bacterium]|nr:VOC family protein [Bacteroidota bacterium]MBP7398752.1 VOC family protein [Chitinophagales bacterium]MBK8487556.1 VOC family protein [Bacteroidota bacterium]MBK8682698.1 VOC family protein [Bacteroidota bacterium]MBP8754576.1 VOC family protein [Chitinophagales bacterium]
MDPNANSLNWFEISVTDFSRAKKFYETMFDITMQEMEMAETKMAFFPANPESGKANGCIALSEMHTASSDGVKIYLNGNPDLNAALNRVETAGGKVTMPKTLIGENNGYMAFFEDSEGNIIGLHSQE